MGRGRDLWEQLSAAFEKQDADAVRELYAVESVYLEPANPPHEGSALIEAYLNSWLQARENLDVQTVRLVESDDGQTFAVEWMISYTAGGRRWHNLPRSSWFDVDEVGIRYHRDYF